LGDKNGRETQDRRESREGCQVASGKRGTCQTVFSFLVWRDTGAAPWGEPSVETICDWHTCRSKLFEPVCGRTPD